jgi:hypothetical protein
LPRGSASFNRNAGNLAPMPRAFPDYPTAIIGSTDSGTDLTMMRWAGRRYRARAARRSSDNQ